MAKLTIKRVAGKDLLVLDEGKTLVHEFFNMVTRDFKSRAIKHKMLKTSVVFEHRGFTWELKAGHNGLAELSLAVSQYDRIEDAVDEYGRFISVANSRGSLNYYEPRNKFRDQLHQFPNDELVLFFTDSHARLHPDFWSELEFYASCRKGKTKKSGSCKDFSYVRHGLSSVIGHLTKRRYDWEVGV